jgi:hypothetical protein
MIEQNSIIKVNNSKKISELRGRDTITYHQDHSWLAVAQYNDRINAYHNIAMNVAAITGYAIENSTLASYEIFDNKLHEYITSYNLSDLYDLSYMTGYYDYDKFSYFIQPDTVAYNLVAYTNEFTQQQLMWLYYPSIDIGSIKLDYIVTDNEDYLLTDKGKKIRIEEE